MSHLAQGLTSMERIWEDDFCGPDLDPRWVGGYFNRSNEVDMSVRDGLRFSFVEGIEYASAGVVTRETLVGDFEAEVHFSVSNPAQGCTFELAAIQVTPPATGTLRPGALDDAYRVFNVHGAPPYVSSEFDENDGWRIGWNLGDRQGGRNAQGDWVADNTDNRYGRSTGGPVVGGAQGWLRLSRSGGDLWLASGRVLETDPWNPAGKKLTERLSGPVYLRLVAKHWVKRRIGARVAPANEVVLTHFRLSA